MTVRAVAAIHKTEEKLNKLLMRESGSQTARHSDKEKNDGHNNSTDKEKNDGHNDGTDEKKNENENNQHSSTDSNMKDREENDLLYDA